MKSIEFRLDFESKELVTHSRDDQLHLLNYILSSRSLRTAFTLVLIPDNDFANEVVVPESRIQTNFQNERSESLPRDTVSMIGGFQVQK